MQYHAGILLGGTVGWVAQALPIMLSWRAQEGPAEMTTCLKPLTTYVATGSKGERKENGLKWQFTRSYNTFLAHAILCLLHRFLEHHVADFRAWLDPPVYELMYDVRRVDNLKCHSGDKSCVSSETLSIAYIHDTWSCCFLSVCGGEYSISCCIRQPLSHRPCSGYNGMRRSFSTARCVC